MVIKSNRFSSLFLLIVYLLTVTYQVYTQDDGLRAVDNSSHQHEEFSAIHHEHHFHVGIFHFLTHLIEAIQVIDVPSIDQPFVANENYELNIKSKKQIWRSDFLLSQGIEDTHTIYFRKIDFNRNFNLTLKICYSHPPFRGPPTRLIS